LLLLLPEVLELVEDVEPEALVLPLPDASPLVDPLVLGEAEVSPLVLVLPLGALLVLPLGALMLPEFELSAGVLLLGVWLVDPVAPPVVELEPEVLGV
jgi:hypothetical protein